VALVLLLAACHTSGSSAGNGRGSKQQQQEDAAPVDVVARAVELRRVCLLVLLWC
jgi:hypothetical protein